MTPTPHSRGRGRAAAFGFTLVETLLATTMSTLLVVGVLTAYVFYSRAYWVNAQVNTLDHNLRSGIDMLARDLRNAGYGLSVPTEDLDDWITWVPGVTNPVMVVQGATTNDPDRLTLAGVMDEAVSSLQFASLEGDTVITVQTGEGAAFNTADRKLLFIGRLEQARVVSISGDTLTLSTSPTGAGVGLRNAYPANTPIEMVSVITYECDPSPSGFPNTPHLLRYTNLSAPPAEVAEGIGALDIEALDVQVESDSLVRVRLVGRTPLPDRHYTHPVFGDGHRRHEVNARVFVRNLP